MKNILSFFNSKINYKYFIEDITYRAVYEQNTKGGIRITVRFEKSVERFGKSKVYSQTITFDNYHTHEKDSYGDSLFTYNPPYVAKEDAHTEDSLWHAILVRENCEEYPFAPINTHQLNIWIDNWDKTVTHTSCPHCSFKHTVNKEIKQINCSSCKKSFMVPI